MLSSLRRMALAMGLIAAVIGCGPKKPRRPPIAARLETVNLAPATVGGRFSGTVHAAKQVTLAFRLGGYVESLGSARAPTKLGTRPLQSGDRVTSGMVLASLRKSDFKQKLSEVAAMSFEASASRGKAKTDLDRAKSLLADGAISKAEFDATKARFDAVTGSSGAAAARVGQAKITLADAQIRSPFDGIVLDRMVEVGALAAPGAPAFVVADTSVVRVVFGVPDTLQRTLALGMEMTVTSDAAPDHVFPAAITKIGAQVDTATHVFEVEASIENPDGVLKVGMVTSIQLANVFSGSPAAIVIPLSAVARRASGQAFTVFIAAGEGKDTTVRSREVHLGALAANRVIVTQGLQVGERIVVQGATIVVDGDHINVVPGAALGGTKPPS